MQWWELDGKKRIAMSIIGAAGAFASLCITYGGCITRMRSHVNRRLTAAESSWKLCVCVCVCVCMLDRSSGGSAAIWFTLFTGWVVHYASLQVALYCMAGWMLLGAVWLTYAIKTGGLDSAPTAEEVHAWMREVDTRKAQGIQLAHVSSVSSFSAQESRNGEQQQGSSNENEDAVVHSTPHRPVGTSPAVPVVVRTRLEAMTYVMTWCVGCVAGMQSFYGWATKVLLSSMFQLIFDLPEMTAAYLSAATLLGFLVSRTAVPLIFIGRGVSSTFLMLCSTMTVCVGYAVLPSIIGSSDFPSAAFSWRLFGFTCVKALISACFGVTQSMTGATAIEQVGVSNSVYAFQAIWFVWFN